MGYTIIYLYIIVILAVAAIKSGASCSKRYSAILSTIIQLLLGIIIIDSKYAQASVAEDLQSKQQELQENKQRYEQLQQDSSKLENELSNIRSKLVEIASAIRQREIKLLTLEERQSKLQQEITTIQDNLKHHQAEITSLLQSLIRLSNTPPEAVVAMPGELRHTLQAANMLSLLTAQIKQRTESLNKLLQKFEQSRSSLQATHREITAEKQLMEKAQATLAVRLEQRKKYYRQLHREQEDIRSQMALLAAEASDLQELLASIEAGTNSNKQQHKRLQALPRAKPKPPSTAKKATIIANKAYQNKQNGRNFTAAKGTLPLPIIGKITKFFGEKLHKNQTHKGLTIVGRQAAQVISPFAGEVVFTGNFMDYGQMVIIRYADDYHLLLAGLGQVDCSVGQHVTSGEPIGRLSANEDKKAQLYLELRHRNNPVNPRPWFI